MPSFPWEEWRAQLVKSPTKALVFGRDDFGEMTTRRFRDLARKQFADAFVGIRGEEVLVALDA